MKVILILILIIITILTYDIIRMYLLYQKTVQLENGFMAFQRIDPNTKQRILVLGDSTAVGTGSSNNIYSTTGRLSSKYPEAEVINISENGLKLSGLNERIKNVSGHFDIIVIQIGANDIIRLTDLETIDTELDKLLKKTKTLSSKVVILHSGNIGESKFFPWYITPILTYRSKEVREIYIRKTSIYESSYVNLIDLHVDGKYYASDKLHLNDEGYKIWFDEIMKKIN
ncbi:SGNH/GDSL hydrolase family protein [Arenimonas sp.]|nr:SGNH/GDSL hydrolase family protein [Candidatus Parcubacteria bacterium]